MNKNFGYGLLVALLALAVFGFKNQDLQPVDGIQKWEYLEVTYKPSMKTKESTYIISDGTGPSKEREFVMGDGPSSSIQMKNELGAQGWELVSHEGPVFLQSGVAIQQPMVFKRLLK